MTFLSKRSRLIAGSISLLILFTIFACNIANEESRTFINVPRDTAWADFDSLEITWKDSVSGAGGVLFADDPATLDETNKLPADGYSGQKIVVTFKGFTAKQLVFEERRTFDSKHPEASTRELIDIGPATPDPLGTKPNPPTLSAIKADSVVTIGDSISFQADASLDSGSLKGFAWDYDGDGKFEDSLRVSGMAAKLAGGHRYPEKGIFNAALKVVSVWDSIATRQIRIQVLQDEPAAEAGKDTTVYADALVRLHGKASDGMGIIKITEWKIGNGSFSVAPGDTSIQAPSVPQDLVSYFRVTDDDGQTTTDSVVIHVVSKTESNLTGLLLSKGELSPQFNPAILVYADTVPFDASSITVTVAGAGTITVNDAEIKEGTASLPIELKKGSNTITISVRLPGTIGKTYSVNVFRPAASSNANLSALSASAGNFDIPFAMDDTLYNISASNGTHSTTITALLEAPTSSLTINGFALASGAVSGGINLNVGVNLIAVSVTSQNGDKKTYTIRITRATSGGTDLKSLVLSAGVMIPVFSSTESSYTLSVPNSTGSTTVTATVPDPASTLLINGQAVESGTARTVDLVVGSNTITVEVTAQNGDKKTYTVRVTRAGNGNADLSGLSASAGTISPAFEPAEVFYSFAVAHAVVSTSVTAVAADSNSILSINNQEVSTGTALSVNLAVGMNSISILVTAQSGDKKSYTLQITRAGSANADLAELGISGRTIAPAFTPETADYSLAVPNDQATATVIAAAADSNASVSINNGNAVSGEAFQVPLGLGANSISIVVKAQNGANKSYSIVVTRALNGNTDLEGIALSAGPVNPAFSAANVAYSLSVANGTVSTTVTPKASSSTSTITVNGTAVPSGMASAAIPLTVGANSIAVVVTAQNGDKKTYTVQATRVGDGNTDLSALIVSDGSIAPAFSPSTVFYSLSVANAITSVKVTPSASVSTSSVTVNGAPVASGNESDPISLNAGVNTVSIVVTAQSGAKNTYQVEITRAGNANADLSGLSLSAASLSPAFSASTQSYAIAVANGVTSTTVTPAVAAGTSTVAVNDAAVPSGTASAFIPLSVGPNTLTVAVTAQNGSVKIYSVVVTRAGDGNANLSGLSVSAGALSPAFSPSTPSYAVSVANTVTTTTVTTTTVTPTVSAGTSSVTVNGIAVASGSASAPISLVVGTNTVNFVVTAQSGATKDYTVTITRAGDGNSDLSGLSASAGDISPAFTPATTLYGISAANSVVSTTVTPTVSVGTATVTVNGVAVASGSASAAIALSVGANPISIEVKAQNNTTKTYTVQVTRAQNGNSDLSGLGLSAGALSPAFAAATTSYSISVGNGVAATTVTPTVAAGTSQVTVDGTNVASGTASGPIALGVGPNAIPVVVTAENGTKKTYTVTITRAQNGNADLSGLAPSAGSLSPVFASATTTYSVTVSNAIASMSFQPTASALTSSIKVNGFAVASGASSSAIDLNVGSNSVSIAVTAQDATVKTYTVMVTRGPNTNASLSGLSLSEGAISPAFSSGTTSYTLNVANGAASTTVTPTVSVGTSTVTVNGSNVASGSASAGISLALGANTLVVEVTAQSGAKNQYTITVTRKVLVASIGTSHYNSYAIKQDGTFFAWGSLAQGQNAIPTDLNPAKAATGGWAHSMALRENGTVASWGRAAEGQTIVPTGLTGVIAIAAGENACIALKSNGTVTAWGSNAGGQLNVPAGLSGVKAIAAGVQHCVALKENGSLVGWAQGGNGQLGWPAGLVGVKAIAAGNYHTIAILEDGTVAAWGSNFHGETVVPPGLTGIKAISAGGENCFAVKADGSVVGWGKNDVGQLDIPTGLTGVKSIVSGLYHTLALKEDGTVVGWGWNDWNQATPPPGLN